MIKTSANFRGLDHPPRLPVDHEFGVLGKRAAEAAELMARSWTSLNVEQSLDYTADFLLSCLEYPDVDPGLSPAIYKDGRLMGFTIGLPNDLYCAGRKLKLLLPTLFTVRPEAKSLGAPLWAESLRRAYAAGYDGTIHFCPSTNKSNVVTYEIARWMRLPVAQVRKVEYLISILRPGGSAASSIPEPPLEDFCRAFLSHTGRLAEHAHLARQWTPAEARWRCGSRHGSIRASFRGQPERGLLTGYILNVADRDRTPCLFIEDILWGDLDESERSELLRDFLQRASACAKLTVVPLMGYADMTPFRQARFRPSPRVMNVYFTVWGGEIPDAVESLYTDVF